MKNFFKGIIFISLFLPIIDGLISLYSRLIEFLCLKIEKKSYMIKKSIQEDEKPESSDTQVIGFEIPNKECEEEDIEEKGENIC